MYKVLGADQKEYGPVDSDQIRQWIAQHRLNAQSLVQSNEDPSWKPLGQVTEFAGLFAAPASAPAQPSPGYSSYPPSMSGPAPRNNPLAVASLILGATAVPMACCCYGFPFNVLGLVFAVIALGQIRRNPAWESGAGFAWAGLILSLVSIVLAVGLFFLALSIDQDVIQEFLDKMQNP